MLRRAAGSGLCALAALRAGAASIVAADIDPLAIEAIALNAEANGARAARRPRFCHIFFTQLIYSRLTTRVRCAAAAFAQATGRQTGWRRRPPTSSPVRVAAASAAPAVKRMPQPRVCVNTARAQNTPTTDKSSYGSALYSSLRLSACPLAASPAPRGRGSGGPRPPRLGRDPRRRRLLRGAPGGGGGGILRPGGAGGGGGLRRRPGPQARRRLLTHKSTHPTLAFNNRASVLGGARGIVVVSDACSGEVGAYIPPPPLALMAFPAAHTPPCAAAMGPSAAHPARRPGWPGRRPGPWTSPRTSPSRAAGPSWPPSTASTGPEPPQPPFFRKTYSLFCLADAKGRRRRTHRGIPAALGGGGTYAASAASAAFPSPAPLSPLHIASACARRVSGRVTSAAQSTSAAAAAAGSPATPPPLGAAAPTPPVHAPPALR